METLIFVVLCIHCITAQVFLHNNVIDSSYPWNYRNPDINVYEDTIDNYNLVNEIVQSKLCNDITGYASYYVPTNLRWFDDCGEVFLCNSTNCLILGSDSVTFSIRINSKSSSVQYFTSHPCNDTKIDRTKNLTCVHSNSLAIHANDTNRLVSYSFIKKGIDVSLVNETLKNTKYNQDVTDLLNNHGHINKYKYQASCDKNKSNLIMIETENDLPIGCYHVRLSNQTSGIMFGVVTQLFHSVVSRNYNSCQVFNSDNSVSYCDSKVHMLNGTDQTIFSFIPFNLPGYVYCNSNPIPQIGEAWRSINELGTLYPTKYVKYNFLTSSFFTQTKPASSLKTKLPWLDSQVRGISFCRKYGNLNRGFTTCLA
jgi:hypothetical protein